ncbi:ABC transporter substrate-binding protein [Streptomyces litchfieldiae]|uniref:ABC transporter substrate-binding protein n=1 Tax=Streptomyces litchfieldiae TaxID=3075543 RepID=A0ABU2MS23_9ACTN|nr:ABC transporter substrate-binding protein [Streptomyces sp. DSM 44938]MDT0344437.1 ABC transporter substrate-binding protein [Streptomyces sp. DSM 44938]
MVWRSQRAVTVIAAGLALGLTAACGSGGGSADDDGPVTITWQAAPFGDRSDDARHYLVDAFEREHPGIDVEVVSAPTNVDTNRASLATQILGQASTPDVYNGDVSWAAQFASAGLALPIGDHVAAGFWDKFDPATVAGASFEGTAYGVPLTLDQSFLYYREDLLEKHGLPVPTTWEEVAEQSEILREAGDVDYGVAWQGASYEGLTCVVNEFLAAGGGGLVTADGSRPDVAAPGSRGALEFLGGLIDDGVSPRATTTYQEPQALQAFTGGQAAFLRNWSYAYDTANAAGSGVAGRVGVTAMPALEQGDGTRASTVGGWNVYINPHTRQQEAALTFVQWLTGAETQRLMAERSSTIPTVDSVRNAPEVRELSPVLRASADNDLVSRPTTSPYYTQVSQATYTTVNSMLSGSLSASEAVRRLASDIEAALAGRRL